MEPYGRTDGTINHCGWVHIPPNGRDHYDWVNTAVVPSICSDWHPDGRGQVEMVSCRNWGCRNDSGASFKVWLMQRLPGNNNTLLVEGKPVRNWWEFVGDFDRALASGKSWCVPALRVLWNRAETCPRAGALATATGPFRPAIVLG